MSKPNSTTTVLKVIAGLSLLSIAAACGNDNGGGGGPLDSKLGYDEARSELVVQLNRELGGGEKLHVRIRSLAEGDTLDCASEMSAIPTYGSRGGGLYGGQGITEDMFEVPTSGNELAGETPEELQTRLEATFYAEVCVSNGGDVLHQARYSLNQALDLIGENGKFDANDDGVRIESNSAYAQACEEELGPNPLFPAVEGSPGDYEMANCLNGTPIPTEVDGVPQDSYGTPCDKPQYIYSHCEPDARTGANGPRVQSARNEQGTSWVLLCRKSLDEEGRYNDIAMIGNNPFTGKTCFFQNQLRGSNGNLTRDSKGTEVPWPGDTVDSVVSPEGNVLWGSRVEGGHTGIGCIKCHSTDAMIHSPWIDGARREDGTAVVPKIGEHPDYVEGYNRPYSLVDQQDQEWIIPRRLMSEEASACGKCHAAGALDQWTTNRQFENGEGCEFCGSAPWINRMVGEDTSWTQLVAESHQGFEDVFWMPPNAGEVLNEDEWAGSDYEAAVNFILACGQNPEDPACVWEDAPTEPGDPTQLPTIETTGPELARAALAAIGARYLDEGNNEVDQNKRCSECHAMSRYNIGGEWLDRTNDAISAGINLNEDPDEYTQEKAMDLVNYMRKDSSNPESVFAPFKIGVFSAGVQFPYFRKLFDKAFGSDGAIAYAGFLARVSMPKGSHPPFSAEEFATVIKWFVDEDTANLEAVMPEAPRPETCADVTAFAGLGANGRPADDSWYTGHLEDMEFEGWHARNVEKGINMFGCGDSTDGTGCFDGFDRAGFSARAGDTDVVVASFDFDTSYWMRTSADGRFIGNGGGGGNTNFSATVTDVIAGRDIGVRGSYDPGFFPNNEGFIMQGGGAGLCGQSVLSNADAIADGIDFTEPGCSNAEGINLYQHVAVDLDGGDYFIINSQFTSDPGSGNSDPRAGFDEGSEMKFSPLVFDGADWDQKEAIDVASPYEGDSVLSPSGRLVVSRFAGPDGNALGHMVRRVEATPAGGSYDIRINTPVRFICTPGAKSNISFDERFSVTHTYENGTANLYLTDLVTMETHQITDMPEGTRALFPHFRSDGWIMFLVQGDGPDRAVGIDSAIVLANQE